MSPSLEPQSHFNYQVHFFILASTSHLTPSAHSTRFLPVFPHPSKMLPCSPSPWDLGLETWALSLAACYLTHQTLSLFGAQPAPRSHVQCTQPHGAAVSPLVTLVSRLASEADLFLYSPIARLEVGGAQSQRLHLQHAPAAKAQRTLQKRRQQGAKSQRSESLWWDCVP